MSREGQEPALADEVLSTTEAAEFCAVDRRTMLRWIGAGLVPSHKTGGGHRRVLRRDLALFMSARGIPMPTDLGGAQKIAIVDDEIVVQKAIRRLVLRHLPRAEVRLAGDGFTAGVLVAGFRPRLLFLDIVMPGMSGLEVCRQIRADRSLDATAIVVVSAHLTPDLEADLARAGADRCLHKPFTSEDIGRALDDFVGAEGRA
jgi:excisionase family DNA binding protein